MAAISDKEILDIFERAGQVHGHKCPSLNTEANPTKLPDLPILKNAAYTVFCSYCVFHLRCQMIKLFGG